MQARGLASFAAGSTVAGVVQRGLEDNVLIPWVRRDVAGPRVDQGRELASLGCHRRSSAIALGAAPFRRILFHPVVGASERRVQASVARGCGCMRA